MLKTLRRVQQERDPRVTVRVEELRRAERAKVREDRKAVRLAEEARLRGVAIREQALADDEARRLIVKTAELEARAEAPTFAEVHFTNGAVIRVALDSDDGNKRQMAQHALTVVANRAVQHNEARIGVVRAEALTGRSGQQVAGPAEIMRYALEENGCFQSVKMGTVTGSVPKGKGK